MRSRLAIAIRPSRDRNRSGIRTSRNRSYRLASARGGSRAWPGPCVHGPWMYVYAGRGSGGCRGRALAFEACFETGLTTGMFAYVHAAGG